MCIRDRVQVAHAAVKDKASPYYVLKYERIAKRRGKKRAIIAIARMILTAVYVMLSNLEEWNPVDLYKVDMPEHLKDCLLYTSSRPHGHSPVRSIRSFHSF